MKLVVLDAVTIGTDLDLSPLSRAAGEEATVYPNSTPSEVKERVRDAEILVINKIKIGEDVLACAEKLRLICITATGYDNINVEACRKRGIAVCNVVGYSTDSVAQLTVAMALSLINRLSEYTSVVRDGSYTRSGVPNVLSPIYHEISGKTWGIVGLGNIGRRVAAVAEALGCRVIAHKRTSDPVYPTVSLETLLAESDIVSLHTPLTPETRGLIGEKEIAGMKDGAILINVARGAVTDERAVAEAVKSGKLGGVGVDVYSVEPFGEEHPFYEIKSLPSVCLTPHMAWSAREARERCIDEIVLNIESFRVGGFRSRVDLS